MPRGAAIWIEAKPGELPDGLFGGIFIYLLEVLPVLQRRGIYPHWSIASRLYGDDPDCMVVPGVLDLAYQPASGHRHTVRLLELKRRHNAVMGSDWPRLHDLWSAYFRIPPRLMAMADGLGDLGRSLGVHYRGGDKNRASWDTNPVSHDDYIAIITDLLLRPHAFERVFVATDEHAFVDRLRAAVALPVVNLGTVRFHTDLAGQSGRRAEADRALLDCLVLSRCARVITTSSALSAFAKVLNPDLPIHRSAASKLFTDIPYFPVAYIEPYKSDAPAVRAILARTMAGDWTQSAAARRFSAGFAFRSRRPYRSAVWRLVEMLRPLT